MSGNFFLDNDDLRFQFEQIDWETLLPLVEIGQDPEEAFTDAKEAQTFFADMLSSIGEFTAEEIAPFALELDDQHPTLENGEVTDAPRMNTILNGLRKLGLMGLILPRRNGGLNAPIMLNSIVQELLGRGDVSVMSAYGFHAGIGAILTSYSIDEGSFEVENGVVTKGRFDHVVDRVAQGTDWGAMSLTEPNAGSDLAQLRSAAKKQDDGSWQITGQKIWITCGHGQHHVVLARSEDLKTHPGLKGLSLFYVPAYIEKDGAQVRNFEVGGLEAKMGQHSGVAATINYDESVGELIGSRGHGFRLMLLLMNNARIAVGFESLGICEAAYRQAKSYAEERVTMGKPIIQHEMIADYLDEMDLTIRGLRALCFRAAFHEEMAHRLRFSLKINPPEESGPKRELEKKIAHHRRRARMLTPLVKYVGSEEAVRFARMDMQILGGVGYMREYGAEKLLRDALVLPIYEGTSQIQSLMVLKDNLQDFLRNPRRALAQLASARVDIILILSQIAV